MKRLLWIIPLFWCVAAFAQTYTANTSVTAVPYPATIPCPGSSCTGGGALTGANFSITGLTDFAGTPIIRVTDSATTAPQHQFTTNCGGSDETNIMDVSNTRIILCGFGQNYIVFSFNEGAKTFTQLYGSYIVPDCGAGSGTQNLFASFTQADIYYGSNFNSSGDPVICRYDFTSAVTGPTVANGKVTTLVDLATCVGALSGIGSSAYLDDVSVSGDDQTFAALASTTAGQGSSGAVYVVVWNQTLGCRVWETDNKAVTGAYGSSPTGSINTASEFILHNVRLGKGGTWVKSAPQSCLNGLCPAATMSGGNFWWDINTLTVTLSADDSSGGCGHTAIGYNNWLNQCATGGQFTNYLIRTMTGAASTGTVIPPSFAAGAYSRSGHISWANNTSGDNAIGLLTADNGSATFAVTNAWDNEVLGIVTGIVYRFAHTYNTNTNSNFSVANSTASISHDGKYAFWTSDWDGMLGKTDNATVACTPSSNCRGDVFMAVLPINAAPSTTPAPALGMFAENWLP